MQVLCNFYATSMQFFPILKQLFIFDSKFHFRCMKLVQHPHVVRLYEVIDTQTKLYLILELGDGGDLYDYIMKHEGGLSESLAREYFRQIVRAISYCHQLHVVHRYELYFYRFFLIFLIFFLQIFFTNL